MEQDIPTLTEQLKDAQWKIHDLERENKALKHNLEHNAKFDEIARKIVQYYKKLSGEFKYEIKDAEFEEWWTRPPISIK